MAGCLILLLGLMLSPALIAAADASPSRVTPGPGERTGVSLPADNTQHALGKFEWARLKTDNPYWNQHAERDQFVIDLMRKQTSLQIGNSWHAARVGHLNELSAYPFLFAESISPLSNTEAAVLAEYLRRGGFLLIDACIRSTVNPDWEKYLASQIKTLVRLFPQVRVEALGPDHEIFSNYFKLAKPLRRRARSRNRPGRTTRPSPCAASFWATV